MKFIMIEAFVSVRRLLTVNSILRRAACLAILLAVASCTTPVTNVSKVEPIPVPAVTEPVTEPELPEVELTSDLLQKLVTSELAYLRNDQNSSINLLNSVAMETKDPRLVETLARRAIAAERHDIADETTQLWVELVPNSADAWKSRGITQLALMQDAEATESFINAMSVSANNPDKILKDISQILSSSMDSISALEMYQEIVAAYPDHVTGHLELFNISLSAGLEVDQLRVHIDNALAIDPGSDTAATTNFAFFLDQGKTEEGEAYAENYLMQFPDSHRLREIYADYLSRAGMIRMAIEQYQILPGPDALFNTANLYLRSDRYAAAYENFNAYVQQVPTDQAAYLGIAQASLELEKYDESALWLNRVTTGNLNFRKNLLRARLEARSQSLQRGLNFLRTLPVQSVGQRIQVYLTVDELYRDADRLEDSLKALDEALQKFPNNNTLLLAHSYVAAELNLVDVVEKDVRIILSRQPNNPQALNSLGYTLADQTDRHDEALKLIEAALELRPKDPYILDSMGWVQYKLGNFDEAIKWIELAYDQLEDPVMAAHLGEIYWMNGERRKARKIWREARNFAPDNKILLETIRKFIN